MASFYLDGLITEKKTEEFEEKVKTGFFRREIRKKTKYFVVCKLVPEVTNSLVLFELEVQKSTYDLLTEGDKVSIHVGVAYEYCCFHSLPERKRAQVVKGTDERNGPKE